MGNSGDGEGDGRGSGTSPASTKLTASPVAGECACKAKSTAWPVGGVYALITQAPAA